MVGLPAHHGKKERKNEQLLVLKMGLEPIRIAAEVFETSLSTYSMHSSIKTFFVLLYKYYITKFAKKQIFLRAEF